MVGYLESETIKYVIATIDNPTTYLIFQNGNITFTKYIQRATKTTNAVTASHIRDEFYIYTSRTDIELVVLPIRISYEILQDDDLIEGGDYEFIS